jgi:hypothetical protein
MSAPRFFDSSIPANNVDSLIASRVRGTPIKPDLVEPKDVAAPAHYNRFAQLDEKDHFRKKLGAALHAEWMKSYGSEKSTTLMQAFMQLTQSVDDSGAVIFGDLIDKQHFANLIQHYTEILQTRGSKSWIHSFVNFGNHPDFLSNADFNGAFLHPLLITLISYAAGGPIRMVDARGKDAEPLAVMAQDNMLHIDNTPFRSEFKIIVTWERGKPSGPKGQNFVFIPGTHKGVRNCFIDADGKAFSTEDASIFITPKAVQQVFDIQKKLSNNNANQVVEVSDKDKPLTTVFQAGALVHHRYRTTEKNIPRSCIIVAFHRAQDNPGQFMRPDQVSHYANDNDLLTLLLGDHRDNTDDHFIKSILQHTNLLVDKIEEIIKEKGTVVLPQKQRELSNEELEVWKKVVTSAPTVEAIKISKINEHDNSKHYLLEMMKYDKHGPLDLILYADGHEEIRKWARNRIREISPDELDKRFTEWSKQLEAPTIHALMLPEQLKQITDQLVIFIDKLDLSARESAQLDSHEKISAVDAYRSLRQCIIDLGEAVLRCDSRQAFLSTSLFIFMASDELTRLFHQPSNELQNIGKKLLNNYSATVALVNMQIQMGMMDVDQIKPRSATIVK